MTPFMLAVSAKLDGEPAAGAEPAECPFDTAPATEPSRTRSIAAAADVQVIVRSLAEQLVSEANAVLRERGDVFELVDGTGPGAFTFTIRYRDREARIATVVSGHTATASLSAPGLDETETRELSGADELQSLLLTLLADPAHA
ncbi:hypothetical protein [Aldersonia kunmingensis]|uniref:hypothetical protein n=1 Tax=Aldersonia kunmingensis TaxID=408066 RepID=UPI000830741C|nr:hypothetical protein [Aldersonia kunmingensis]